MSFFQRNIRSVCIFFINHFFTGTHFWGIKRTLLRWGGIQCGKTVKVVGPFFVSKCSQVDLGDDNWIGAHFAIRGDGSFRMGNCCDIAPDVTVVTGSHKLGSAQRRAGEGISLSVSVGNGCWIGARATLLGNLSLDNGCVVGAGALVNKSFGENVLLAGVPARAIRRLEEKVEGVQAHGC